MVAKVFCNYVQHFLEDSKQVSEILENEDIFAYHVVKYSDVPLGVDTTGETTETTLATTIAGTGTGTPTTATVTAAASAIGTTPGSPSTSLPTSASTPATPPNKQICVTSCSLGCVTILVQQRSVLPKSVFSGRGFTHEASIISFPFLVNIPRKISYAELHSFLSKYVSKFTRAECQSSGKRVFPSSEELMKNFDISIVSSTGSTRLLEFDGNDYKFSLRDDVMLAIDWGLMGVHNNLYKKRDSESVMLGVGEEQKFDVDLMMCLKDFVREEVLTKHDSWYCPTCKEMQQATKKMDIWKFPKILRIDLKRFQNRGFWLGQKITKFVDYPFTLDLQEFKVTSCDSCLVYDLFAVACHEGVTAQMGHYTAFCKNSLDKKWYLFNDSKVTEVREKDVVTASAYILFYKRQDVQDPMEAIS
eukprot:TRINITY_DN15035_c0_g5_i2.p1 TRINITY_DN15035_c0_g5~~TRINITY_DN15035_c0_g5_i2.p1  ORF type:complete len:417 (+),score=88.90 TRINITY_DN15035_c0_g5_i2:872-2122(+)